MRNTIASRNVGGEARDRSTADGGRLTTVRAGVIGVGRKGLTIDDEGKCPVNYVAGPASHAAAYAAFPETELVAIADPDPAALARASDRHPGARRYAGYEEMLERESLGIVSIATHAPLHAAATIAAAEAGVSIIVCEKAMATSMAECDMMLDAVQRSGSTLVVDYPRRYHPTFVAARQAIAEGMIGRVRLIVGTVGGWMVHNGTHFLDLFRFFAGPAEAVWGTLESMEGNDANGSATVQLANGVVGILDARSHTEVLLTCYGESGRIAIDASTPGFELVTYEPGTAEHGAGTSWYHGAPCNERRVRQVVPALVEDTMATLLRDAIASAAAREEPRSSGADGAAALEIALGAFASSAIGGAAVQLPLSDRGLKVLSR
jgi:predicted dehydrogenase